MKEITTFLSNPIATDDYGTSNLTGLELLLAIALVGCTFAYLITRDGLLGRKIPEHHEGA